MGLDSSIGCVVGLRPETHGADYLGFTAYRGQDVLGFLNDGYEVLGVMDDDGDGWLTGDELQGLALWRDANGNAVSEPGEVKQVAAHGVVALSCGSIPHPSGIPFSPEGVVFSNGRREASYDWVVRCH